MYKLTWKIVTGAQNPNDKCTHNKEITTIKQENLYTTMDKLINTMTDIIDTGAINSNIDSIELLIYKLDSHSNTLITNIDLFNREYLTV